MAFLENAKLPESLRWGVSGGPEFATRIIEVNSGFEQRAAAWAISRGRWQADWGPYDTATKDALIDFFRAVKGRLVGFRFKDPSDFTDAGRGRLGASGVGTGLPTYQLTKLHIAGSLSDARPIRKPVAGTVAVQRNGVPVVFGAGAGQVQLDTTTGIVTFKPDAQYSVSGAVATGSTTSVTFAGPVSTTVGDIVHLADLTGTAAALLNGPRVVTARSGNTLTFAVNTAGLAASGGTGARYPQPVDVLTYAGQHDTPVRFDTDRLDLRAVDRGLWDVQGIVLVEIRQ